MLFLSKNRSAGVVEIATKLNGGTLSVYSGVGLHYAQENGKCKVRVLAWIILRCWLYRHMPDQGSLHIR